MLTKSRSESNKELRWRRGKGKYKKGLKEKKLEVEFLNKRLKKGN
jgi:hypothetical protein